MEGYTENIEKFAPESSGAKLQTYLEKFVYERLHSMPNSDDEALTDEDPVHDRINPNRVNRQVRAFLLYKKYVTGASRVLDLGCKHAVDAQMVREVNPNAEIHAADFWDFSGLAAFAASRIQYHRLAHSWHTGLEDNYFDTIIMSGSLEHVPNEAETLKEVFRILKPDGRLIITFLPNSRSWSEFAMREVFLRWRDAGVVYHNRLYRLPYIRAALKRSGFLPMEWGYHQFLPSMVEGHRFVKTRTLRSLLDRVFKLDPLFERLWPFRLFCANLYVIAEKRVYL